MWLIFDYNSFYGLDYIFKTFMLQVSSCNFGTYFDMYHEEKILKIKARLSEAKRMAHTS